MVKKLGRRKITRSEAEQGGEAITSVAIGRPLRYDDEKGAARVTWACEFFDNRIGATPPRRLWARRKGRMAVLALLCRAAVVELEQPAEPFVTQDQPGARRVCAFAGRDGEENYVAFLLMCAFPMIMFDELGDGTLQRRFAEEGQVIEALFLNGPSTTTPTSAPASPAATARSPPGPSMIRCN